MAISDNLAVMVVVNIIRLLKLALSFLRLWFQSDAEVRAECLVLRQQLATYKHEGRRPHITGADRVFWCFLRRVWPRWKNALVIVSPETVVRWHQEGFRLFWDTLSRKGRKPGRPQTNREIRELILRMARENPGWGAPKIHGELLKLGFDVSESTVSRYMPKPKPDPDKVELWKAFLRNHREAIAAMDFFTIPTLTFNVLYVLVIIRHGRRLVVHFNVTFGPSAQWVAQQLREAFPFDTAPRYLIFDRDSTFSAYAVETIKSFGIKPVRTSFRSPWQNGVMERWIGSCRRELLTYVIVFDDRHALRLLSEFIDYYNNDRCHLALVKDAPVPRPVELRSSEGAKVIALPRAGGVQHRYEWRDAA